jgi:Reverse transcriptase (RNA-dependent DNA polymerase)
MLPEAIRDSPQLLRWKHVYREAELYKAAIRVYTKPLFQWRKALNASVDGRTLYDLAARGIRGLDAIHRSLQNETFGFRAGVGLKYNFNGKRRTLYIPPWEERIVDLLLYRILNRRLHHWFSQNSYAYRDGVYSLDHCQRRIAHLLRTAASALYLVKRDISDYFGTINHELLFHQLAQLVAPDDYLFSLLKQRVKFAYEDENGSHQAGIGVPFGCASACVLANIYLTSLDSAISRISGVHYLRYADDLLLLSTNRDAALAAAEVVQVTLRSLRLTTKATHEANLVIGGRPQPDARFISSRELRHLGLLFRAGGEVALSRDKQRKIQNLFRFAFRRARRRWRKLNAPKERARTLAAIAAEVVEKGVRNVAIIDYYLKHVSDERQLRTLDLWLAEEVLSLVFGGHKKGHFHKISFEELRQMGLPSLLHRRRSILAGRIQSPFLIWQRQKAIRAFKGMAVRLHRAARRDLAFSPLPEAAASRCP